MRALIFSVLFVLGFAFAMMLGPALQIQTLPSRAAPSKNILQNPGTEKDELLKKLKQEISSTDSTPVTYHSLRIENLKENPQLQLAVTPELRSFAIDSLVARLSDSDWILWKENLSSYGSSKSDARRWLDKIKVVNFELGRYLETSALLFTALYNASTMGKAFSVEEELYELSTEAGTLFHAITPKAYSPRINLDTSVTSDPSFLIWLERLRSQFVINYSKKEPKQLETQLLLLASVKQEFLTPGVIDNYIRLLSFATKEISPKYRLELKDHYLQHGREHELMEISKDFSNSFEEFYAKCIDDAIIEGEIPRAKALLLKYGGYFPNSPLVIAMQEKIAELEIDKRTKAEALINEPKQVPAELGSSKIGFSDFLSGTTDRSSLRDLVERVGTWILIILTLGLVVIKSMPLVLLFFNSRRLRKEREFAKKIAAEKAEQNDSEETGDDSRGKMIPITKPLTAKGSKYREKRQANS